MANPRDDDDLIPLLQEADPEDLAILVDYITDSGKGRISLNNLKMSSLVAAKARQVFSEADRLLIADEIQLFGGHSLLNIFRGGEGVPYREIVRDVADHLKVAHENSDLVEEIENFILEKIAAKAWEKMSDDEKSEFAHSFGAGVVGFGPAALAVIIAAIRASGFGAYKFAAVVANAVARQLLGRGLAFGAVAPVMQGMAILAGPLGWALGILWAAYDLASPSYRVTVPCVVQIAYMRKKRLGVSCLPCELLPI